MPVILEWEDLKGFSYEVSRSATGTEGTFVLQASGVIGTAHRDPTGTLSDFYQIREVDKTGTKLRITTPFIVYDSPDNTVCRVFGNIADATGRPEADAEIRFQIRRETLPEELTGKAITKDQATAFTNESGNFQLYLLRNITVEVYIPNSRFSLEFMVPGQDDLDFTAIEGVFGNASPINNPF